MTKETRQKITELLNDKGIFTKELMAYFEEFYNRNRDEINELHIELEDILLLVQHDLYLKERGKPVVTKLEILQAELKRSYFTSPLDFHRTIEHNQRIDTIIELLEFIKYLYINREISQKKVEKML